MSLPRYPAYKDSGVGWLGEVPMHWQSWKVSHAFGAIGSGTTPPSDDATWYSDGTIPWVTTGELREAVVHKTTKSVTATAIERFSALKLHPAGSLVIAMYGATIGRVGILGVDATTNQACCVLSRPGNLNVRFVFHWLQGFKQILIDVLATGGGQPNINQETIASLRIPAPPQAEQMTIAAFLDRETGKIDTLIAEQEKLIALLAEKRQATISHAVTKGLNPDAPMKDAGVAWLGEVPSHWRVGKIQNFARRESGHTPSRQHPEWWENCTIPWFSLADVWQLRTGNVKYVYETKELVSELGLANSSARLLPAGTVMLSRTASVGYSAIMGCAMATTQDFINWVCKSELAPEFLLYVLRGMKSEFDRLMIGSTHQTIYMPDVARLMMGLPPLAEQGEIVAFLDAETSRLDALTAEAVRAIDLLKERRSALIAAAVTGQIDVRQVLTC